MTVRNVRAHQSRGLLPPPEVRGRTGYYGAEHVARIELIRELQADGFNLELIRRLLESAGSSTAALRFARACARRTATRRRRSSRQRSSPRAGARTTRSCSSAPRSSGSCARSATGASRRSRPTLGRVSGELAELGISARQALEVAGSLRRHADSVARAYMKLFVEAVWKPFEAEGRPEERWPEVSRGARAAAPAGRRVAARRCSGWPWTTPPSARSGASSSACPTPRAVTLTSIGVPPFHGRSLSTREITLHGHRVTYRRAGWGPLLVLIHGITGSSRRPGAT